MVDRVGSEIVVSTIFEHFKILPPSMIYVSKFLFLDVHENTFIYISENHDLLTKSLSIFS